MQEPSVVFCDYVEERRIPTGFAVVYSMIVSRSICDRLVEQRKVEAGSAGDEINPQYRILVAVFALGEP